MAKVVRFSDNYVSKAYELLKLKSKTDDIKAEKDLNVVNDVLRGRNTCISPYELDNRLRREYKTIEIMESIGNKFSFNDSRPMNTAYMETERIMNRLKFDKYGIVADVLIKHNLIESVEEFYVKPKMGNRNIYTEGIK